MEVMVVEEGACYGDRGGWVVGCEVVKTETTDEYGGVTLLHGTVWYGTPFPIHCIAELCEKSAATACRSACVTSHESDMQQLNRGISGQSS